MSERLEVRIPREIKERLSEISYFEKKSISEMVREILEVLITLKEREIPVELLKEATKKEPERKYILEITEHWRQGPAFVDKKETMIVYGEAEKVIVDEWCDSYPYNCYSKVIYVPKTIPVIIIEREVADNVDPPIDKTYLYVFTKKGWVKVDVK